MATLVHGIWEEDGPDGALASVCLAGPDGDGCRAALKRSPRLVTTFEAGSHVEAMTIYYRLSGRGAYTTDQAWDDEPYPEEWAERQRTAGKCG
jgi:hypothetical protein